MDWPVSLTIGRNTSKKGLLLDNTSVESESAEAESVSAVPSILNSSKLSVGVSSTFSASTRSRMRSFTLTKNGSTSAPSYIFQN